MAEPFLSLPRGARAEILDTLAVRSGSEAELLEKDTWICWSLQQVFSMPGLPSMVFKGGTSLSKVYGAIRRFSEDVDITIDCRSLVPAFDPFATGTSRSALRRHDDRLRAAAATVVRDVLRPGLERAAERVAGAACTVEPSEDGEHLYVRYESALPPSTGYLKRQVDLEIGGRNSILPSESRTIAAEMAPLSAALTFPEARVDVLRPERTFWEKVTLLHAEVGRGDLRPGSSRLSRHWHDVATLADHAIGRRALVDRDLLRDVVKFKSVFYPHSKARYDLCLEEQARLVPGGAMCEALRADYQEMVRARMFDGEPAPFDQVLDRIQRLEQELNGLASPLAP